MLSKEEIKEILLANGFKEREQEDGSVDLNPYVYTAIDAILKAYGNKLSSNIREKLDNYLEGLKADNTLRTNEHLTVDMLAKVASSGPSEGTMSLACQLLGVPPCPVCGFVKQHCKCITIHVTTLKGTEELKAYKKDIFESKEPVYKIFELPRLDTIDSHETINTFPIEGVEGRLYIDHSTGINYTWVSNQYKPMMIVPNLTSVIDPDKLDKESKE